MRRKLFIPSLLAVLIAATPFFGSQTKYETDTAHSNIGFAVPIAGGLSHVRGKFNDFTVAIVYDDKDVSKSSVHAVIKATSIDTGIERRDNHLRTADFFEVEKYPEITFKSSSVVKKGKGYVARGTFTMRGVSKEIDLPFVILASTAMRRPADPAPIDGQEHGKSPGLGANVSQRPSTLSRLHDSRLD